MEGDIYYKLNICQSFFIYLATFTHNCYFSLLILQAILVTLVISDVLISVTQRNFEHSDMPLWAGYITQRPIVKKSSWVATQYGQIQFRIPLYGQIQCLMNPYWLERRPQINCREPVDASDLGPFLMVVYRGGLCIVRIYLKSNI